MQPSFWRALIQPAATPTLDETLLLLQDGVGVRTASDLGELTPRRHLLRSPVGMDRLADPAFLQLDAN